MAKQKIKSETILTQGQFEDIVAPSFELFDITLKQRDYQTKDINTNNLIASDKSFEILIGASKIANSFIPQLSDELKVAFGLSFAPFQRETKTYNFYTSKYSGDTTRKKEILNGVFDVLIDFEKDYKEKIANQVPIFQKAKSELKNFETEEFDVRFSHKLDTFVVVAKSFIGPDSYRKLASCSQQKGKVLENQEVIELFNNKYNKKSFFVINKNDFIGISDYIRDLKDSQDNFVKTQDTVFQTDIQRHTDLLYSRPNVFDYKVEINDERKCFVFFCKGYEPSKYEGNSSPRNLLQNWALNFILSSHIDTMKGDDYENEYEIVQNNYYKEKLAYLKDSSKKDKSYFVPFTEIDKLEKIYENFKKEEDFWSRPQFDIKKEVTFFSKESSGVNLSKFPAIYFDSEGSAFLTFDYKEVRRKALSAKVINMKGIKITPQEFEMFTTTHPMADKIAQNSEYLNTVLWAGHQTTYNRIEMEQAYENVLMAYRIHNAPKDDKPVKRMKI